METGLIARFVLCAFYRLFLNGIEDGVQRKDKIITANLDTLQVQICKRIWIPFEDSPLLPYQIFILTICIVFGICLFDKGYESFVSTFTIIREISTLWLRKFVVSVTLYLLQAIGYPLPSPHHEGRLTFHSLARFCVRPRLFQSLEPAALPRSSSIKVGILSDDKRLRKRYTSFKYTQTYNAYFIYT